MDHFCEVEFRGVDTTFTVQLTLTYVTSCGCRNEAKQYSGNEELTLIDLGLTYRNSPSELNIEEENAINGQGLIVDF